MSGEIIAVLGMGAALAGLLLTSFRALRQDIQEQIGALREEVAQLRGDIAEIRGDIASLRERMAHLEGLLEGLREAISGRVGGP